MTLDLAYPPATKGVVVVWSLIASLPIPGTAWHRLQYLAGLRRLGFDVWYVEELDRRLNRPGDFVSTTDFAANLQYLKALMDQIGFSDRWIFRPPGHEECFGARDFKGLLDLYAEADLVINHTGAQLLQPWHSNIRSLAYLETDPVRNQVNMAQGNEKLTGELLKYDYLLSYGLNLGQADCKVPVGELHWIPTLPAICVDWWATKSPLRSPRTLTTVTAWKRSHKKDLQWDEASWRWSKAEGFLSFLDVPQHSRLPMELALRGANDEEEQLFRQHGWLVKKASDLDNPDAYRDYITTSAGEFTAAKEQYVASWSGWFSDRSASYLAAGRPVISQDTGFSNSLPTGSGLFAISTVTEAVEAVNRVADDFERQSKAALDIAHEHFSAERVLGNAMRAIGLL